MTRKTPLEKGILTMLAFAMTTVITAVIALLMFLMTIETAKLIIIPAILVGVFGIVWWAIYSVLEIQ